MGRSCRPCSGVTAIGGSEASLSWAGLAGLARLPLSAASLSWAGLAGLARGYSRSKSAPRVEGLAGLARQVRMTRPTAANCREMATLYENVEGRSAARRARRDRYGAASYTIIQSCSCVHCIGIPTRTLRLSCTRARRPCYRRRFEAPARKDSGGGEARACRARERDVGGTVGERAFSLSNPPILIPNTLAALAFAHRQRRPCSTDTWWALRVAGG